MTDNNVDMITNSREKIFDRYKNFMYWTRLWETFGNHKEH